MCKADGDRATAAKYLGVAYIQISQAISRHPALRSQWIKKDDNYVDVVASDSPRLTDRHPTGEVRTSDEIRATALTNVENKQVAVGADRSLSKSLSKLGFRANEIEKLTTVEEFAGQHFTKTLALMHGGIIKGAMRIMLLIEKIEADYLQDDNLSDEDRKFYWDIYFRLIESLRSLGEQSNKAAITRALVNQKGKPNGLPKPGYTAIQINVGKKDERPNGS